jgi:phenylalanyl-tRNA synthetase beta chain
MIKILSENIDAEYPQKIFETGRVFGVDGKGNVLEKESLAIAVSPGNFTDARQIIEYLAESIGRKITFKEAEEFPEHFVEGRVADIIFQDRKIGIVGEMHPKILKNWKIKMPVSLFEMSLDGIFEEFGEK